SFFQAEDGIRVFHVTGVQTCALPILRSGHAVMVRSIWINPPATIDMFSGLRGQIYRSHIFLVLHTLKPFQPLKVRGGAMDYRYRSEERRVGKERGIWLA